MCGLVGIALALAGCGSSPAQPVAAPSAPAASATASAGMSSAAPTTIPAEVFLSGTELKGAQRQRPEADQAPEWRPPRLCSAGGPSDAQRTAAAAMTYLWTGPPTAGSWPQRPTSVLHVVLLFAGDGATRYMDEVRNDLATCPPTGKDKRDWTAGPADSRVPADALLIADSQDIVYGDTPSRLTAWVMVARVDNAVVVLADGGYEDADGDKDTVLTLIGPALDRARSAT